MTDDIVTRLRAEGEINSVGDGTKEWWSNPVCLEAANEIERLRAKNHGLRIRVFTLLKKLEEK